MAYELRVPGQPARRFETEPEAVAAARQDLADDPDLELEVIDLATGRACAPGASAAWREEMRGRVGF